MYLDFYGLREPPFNLTPDPEFFFLSAGHKKALVYLSYGITHRKGFMQLTGEVGSGKTMIIRRLLDELHEEAVTAYVLNPADTFAGLLEFILKDLGVPIPAGTAQTKTALLDTLYRFLLDKEAAKVPVVIIFDEAQNLSMDVLEEIRMISNFETTKEKLLQIVFVGQPEFREIAASPQLRQLAQRIAIRHHLGPLRQTEVAAYLDHRLNVAGGERIHFTAMAKDIIWDYTGGIPRLINAVSDYALLAGYVNETCVLNHRILNEAIAELEGRAEPLDGKDGYDSPWQSEGHDSARRRRGRRMRRARRGSPEEPASAPAPLTAPGQATFPVTHQASPAAPPTPVMHAVAPARPDQTQRTGSTAPAPTFALRAVATPRDTPKWQRQVVAPGATTSNPARGETTRARALAPAETRPQASAAPPLRPVTGRTVAPEPRATQPGLWGGLRRLGHMLFGWLL